MSQNDVPESLEAAAESDRPRGILTPSDRDFLLGAQDGLHGPFAETEAKPDPTARQERDPRFQHPLRVSRGARSKTVFDPNDEDREAYTQGITDMLAFLHLGTMGYHTPFKDMLSEGVGKAEQQLAGSNYRMVNVEFNVEPVGQIDVDEVVAKLENDEFAELTDEELRAFVRLLTMSDSSFSPEDAGEEIKDRVDEFAEKLTESAASHERTLEELTN